MSEKRLSHAYRTALKRHGMTQAAFSETHGIAQSELTRVAQGQFPNDRILLALATGWPEVGTGLEILEAHLLDECERAGVKRAALPLGGKDVGDDLRGDLREIELFFREHPDLNSALRRFAEVLKSARRAPEVASAMVAEPGAADPPMAVKAPKKGVIYRRRK